MLSRFNTVNELVEHAFTAYADKPAYTCLGHTLSFKELDERSAAFASYLHHELNLQPGDRFAIQLPNTLQFPVAMCGAIRAGLIVVNINPLYTPRELKHQLNDCGAKGLLVLSNIANCAAEVIKDTEVEQVIVTDLADDFPTPKRQVINFAVRYLKKMVPPFHFDKSLSYREVIATPAKPFSIPQANNDTVLMLQYTGGTTGVSKGAMLTHGNVTGNVWQVMKHMPSAFDEGKEVFVACLPLYHIYALNLHALASFAVGSHNILIPNPRDFKAFIKALKGVPFTVFIGINTLFRALVRYEPFSHVDFSHLKITSAGGMALSEDAAVGWEKITGCPVLEGYGLTETSPVLTGNQPDSLQLGSIGKALPETEIVLLDDNGVEVAFGEVGELCARGPQVMAGYWQRPDETELVMTQDGFFKTGDMAVELEGGLYKIVDRKKDLILVSGFNVYPNEIEDVLTLHPNIVEAAAVGIPDLESGEKIKVFIVTEGEGVSEQEVIAYCRERLTRYKVPKLVAFKDELPKSNVGKILRRELRDQ